VSDPVVTRLTAAFESDDRPVVERDRLLRLMALFAALPPPPDTGGHFPRYAELHAEFRDSFPSNDPEQIEESFLELYAHLHMHEAPYSPEERRRKDETGGYWAHAGGLSPILKAGDWLRPDSVSADLGAGNGLQGLLFQKLYPHACTVQVEISSEMIAIGRQLQGWLEIPENGIEWVVGDVMDAPVQGIDFLYLYRPVRPDGPGRAFYERIAAQLDGSDSDVVIFSIADCLRDFLSPRFEVFYSDGHLTCFKKTPSPDS
jgi:SAM-dependent methyltransferase